MFLQDSNLVWNHTPGTTMGPANMLSCKDVVDTSKDNSFQVLLPNIQINMLDAALAEKISESTPTDQFVINALTALDVETVHLPCSQKDDWYFNQAPSITSATQTFLATDPKVHTLVVQLLYKSLQAHNQISEH